MILDILLTICVCCVVIGAGWISLSFLFKGSMNGYLKFAISFVLGNLWFIVVLTLLAYFELLSWVPALFWMVAVGELSFFAMYLRKRNMSISSRVDRNHLFIIAGICAIALLLLSHDFFQPLDMWDTRGIWLIKAKAFFLGDGFRNEFLQSSYYTLNHKAYPNGLSLMISMIFRLFGHINENAVKLYLSVFYIDIIVLIVGIMKHLFSRISWQWILILVCTLFVSWKFTVYGVSGYADVPLAFSFAVSTVCMLLAIHETSREDRMQFLILSILSGILGLNIKNEGLPFFFTIVIGVFIVVLYYRKLIADMVRKHIKQSALIFLVILIGLSSELLWRSARTQIGIPSDVPLDLDGRTVSELLHNITLIASAFASEFTNSAHWGILIAPVVVVFLSSTAVLFWKKSLRVYAVPACVVVLQLCIYFGIYLFSDREISWHLATSLDRLVLHVIPSIICIVFFYVAMLIPMLGKGGNNNG